MNSNVRKSMYGLIALAGIIFSTVGCHSVPGDKLPPPPAAEPAGTLGIGDVIKLSFPGTPELNQLAKIRSDGRVNLPMVGEIKAAGKKLLAFQAEVAELYKPVLKDTEIFVSLDSAATPFVTVNGAVKKSGAVACEKPTTLFDAIMQAGGFTPEADLKRVRVTRLIKGEYRSQFFDMRSATTGAPIHAEYVKGGDYISVPEKTVNF